MAKLDDHIRRNFPALGVEQTPPGEAEWNDRRSAMLEARKSECRLSGMKPSAYEAVSDIYAQLLCNWVEEYLYSLTVFSVT